MIDEAKNGEMQICSVVQLCGCFLCLLGAARITHRAQGIVSIATRWHMLVTNASTESESDCQWKSQTPSNNQGMGNESDSDSSDIYISVTTQQPSSFQTRQALGECYVINTLYSVMLENVHDTMLGIICMYIDIYSCYI